MIDWAEYVAGLKREIETLKEQLRPLEDGTMHTGERPFNGQWRDTTQEQAAMLRRAIATIQSVVDRRPDA